MTSARTATGDAAVFGSVNMYPGEGSMHNSPTPGTCTDHHGCLSSDTRDNDTQRRVRNFPAAAPSGRGDRQISSISTIRGLVAHLTFRQPFVFITRFSAALFGTNVSSIIFPQRRVQGTVRPFGPLLAIVPSILSTNGCRSAPLYLILLGDVATGSVAFALLPNFGILVYASFDDHLQHMLPREESDWNARLLAILHQRREFPRKVLSGISMRPATTGLVELRGLRSPIRHLFAYQVTGHLPRISKGRRVAAALSEFTTRLLIHQNVIRNHSTSGLFPQIHLR